MRDFGIVYLEQNINPEEFRPYPHLEELMKSNGWDLTKYDICSTRYEWSDEQVEVKFKCVHHLVPTAESRPFMKVTFKEA